MKCDKKDIAVYILITGWSLFSFFRPTIIFHGPPYSDCELSNFMNVYDKYYDDDWSGWYMEKMRRSFSVTFKCKAGEDIGFRFPLFYDKKGPGNFIFDCLILDPPEFISEGMEVYPIGIFAINAEELYFFRIHIYIDDSVKNFEGYIQKYPWTKKVAFPLDDPIHIWRQYIYDERDTGGGTDRTAAFSPA